MRGTRKETVTLGFDPAFQGIGSDPSGGGYFTGIRVPEDPAETNIPRNRYLFLLAFRRLSPQDVVIVDGFRQYVDLVATTTSGTDEDPGPTIERFWEVTSPMWHFTDANIVWYLNFVPQQANPPSPKNADGLAFRYANTPALLFEHDFSEGGGYTAPYGGRPPGSAIGGLGPIYDLRSLWRANTAWDSLGATVKGPGDICLFASVRQTNPVARPKLTTGGVTLPAGIQYYAPPEDLFVMNSEAVNAASKGRAAIYGRIAGSIILRDPNPYTWIAKDAQSKDWRGCKPPKRSKGTK